MHRKNILIHLYVYIQQDATLHSLFDLETALHASGGITHVIRSANNCIYSIWYLSHRYCYLPLSWKIWNCFEWAMGGARHPQHTQTSSNSSTIVAGSSNGVTNTRCCIYSCLRSWWWVWYHPKHVEQFPDQINRVTLHLVGCVLEHFVCLHFLPHATLLHNRNTTKYRLTPLCLPTNSRRKAYNCDSTR